MRHHLAFLVLPLLCFSAAQAEPPSGPLQVYAHRGVRALRPENTLPGYEAALKIGTHWVDMDVALSKDGEVVVTHDPVLNPNLVRDGKNRFLAKNKEAFAKMSPEEVAAFNEKFAISHLNFDEIEKYDVGRINRKSSYAKFFKDQKAIDGQKIPTLREVIRYVKANTDDRIGFQVEVKTEPAHPEFSADPKLFAQALYKILSEENIVERTEIQAFDFRVLRELQALDSRSKTAYLTSRENERGGADSFYSDDPAVATLWTGGPRVTDYEGSIPKMIKALGGFAWEPEDAQLTPETLAEAHRLGLKVVVWSWPEMAGTAFDPVMTQKMIDWRVDGIITDDPGRLNRMLEKQGLPTPPKYRPRPVR